MALTRDYSHYVKELDTGLAHLDLAVEGVSCAGCMAKIERGLSAMPDVTRARVNLTDRRLAVEWNEGKGRCGRRGRPCPRARLWGLSVRAGAGRDCRGRAVALPAALPWRCGLC